MRLDKDGRITLPKSAVDFMDIDENTELSLSVEKDKIVIKRKYSECIFCGCPINLIGIKEYYVCEKCKDKLSKVKTGDRIY